MKTVLQVVQHLRPGGIETIALDLISFASQDEQHFIVSLEGDLASAIKQWPKLASFEKQLIFLNKQPGLSYSLLFSLLKLFKNMSPVAVHTHHIGPLLYAGLAARLSSVKHLIHTEHDAWHLNDKKCRLLQRNAIKVLHPTLIADAKTVAEQMKIRLKSKHKIRVIRNGINCETFTPGNKPSARAHFDLPEDKVIIGCSGRMEKVKGQCVLINALSILPKHVHLVFAGSGSTETALRELVDMLALNERVHFLGHVDQMPRFYQSLDIFCLPSLNEGFPLSPLEAQTCNITTLVTNVGASKETVCPVTGRYVVPNNASAMAKVLKEMLMTVNECSPRTFVEQHGNLRSMINAYASLRHSPQFTGVCYE